ncbi:MAG: hypothetical protein Q9201_001251 [Fulgogasparrea decipioides]
MSLPDPPTVAISEPSIIIVPGAWHQLSAYEKFITSLESEGYTATSISLPSCNANEPRTASCSTDAAAVRTHILSLLDNEGKDVILVCHSYGGFPGAGAASGLSKRARVQKGKKTGVLGLVYVCSFVVPEKSSLLETIGGKHAPYVNTDQVGDLSRQLRTSHDLCVVVKQTTDYYWLIQPSPGQSTIQDPRNVLYNDLDDTESDNLIRLLRPTSMYAFDTSAPPPAWAEPEYAGSLLFIRCTQDKAIPLPLQGTFVERSGVQWTVKDIEASHFAFASKPEELVKMLRDFKQQLGN